MAYRGRVKSLNVPRSRRKDEDEAEAFQKSSLLFTVVHRVVLLFAIDRNNSKA
jgi:hypothetical protein